MTRNAYELANIAGVPSPDSADSPGAVFLLRVADAVADRVGDPESIGDLGDVAHEIADDAANLIYTRTIWETFLDLAAYQEWDEYESEFGREWGGASYGDGMDALAVTLLYRIAERLAVELIELDGIGDDDEEGEDS